MMVSLTRRAVVAAAVTSSLLAAASPVLASPATSRIRAGTTTGWPQLQGNAAHTGFEPAETSVTSANVGQLAEAWTAPLSSASNLIGTEGMTVAGGTVYGTSVTAVIALNAVTGAQRWQASLPGVVASTPAVQGGLVITGYNVSHGFVESTHIVALSAATGATVWTHLVPAAHLIASVTTTPTTVYAALDTGQILALHAGTGHQQWLSAALPGCQLSAPSVSGGLVVAGDGGQYVTALHAADGTKAWQNKFSNGCGNGDNVWIPAISGSTVYAGRLNGVAALNLDSGRVLWANRAAGHVFQPLSVTGTAVIAGANNDFQPTGLARSTGAQLWQYPPQGQIAFSAFATFGSLTWVLANDFVNSTVQAVAFDPATGHQVFTSAAYPDPANSPPPVVAAGRVYLDLATEVLCLTLPGARTGVDVHTEGAAW